MYIKSQAGIISRPWPISPRMFQGKPTLEGSVGLSNGNNIQQVFQRNVLLLLTGSLVSFMAKLKGHQMAICLVDRGYHKINKVPGSLPGCLNLPLLTHHLLLSFPHQNFIFSSMDLLLFPCMYQSFKMPSSFHICWSFCLLFPPLFACLCCCLLFKNSSFMSPTLGSLPLWCLFRYTGWLKII